MRRLAQVHHKKRTEPIWHVQFALIIIVGLQLLLDHSLVFGPKYGIAGLELVLLLSLLALAQSDKAIAVRRTLAIALTALVSVANVVSLGLVIATLFNAEHLASGTTLMISAVSIYLTNIIIFGLWYWEMDFKRGELPQDFLFAQENAPEHAALHNQGWLPTFFDYLYISITNATAFSPTDTLPLTHRAKLLMALQSLISLTVVVLVTARAVSIIG